MENAAERRQSKKPGKDIPWNSPCYGRAMGRRHTGGLTWRDIHTLTVENGGLKLAIDNQMAMIVGLAEAATAGDARAATVIVKLLGEETPREDTGADQLTRAAELLEGIDGVIE